MDARADMHDGATGEIEHARDAQNPMVPYIMCAIGE
jgi:hypothetical protein